MENAINKNIEYKGKIEEIVRHAGEMMKMNSPSTRVSGVRYQKLQIKV